MVCTEGQTYHINMRRFVIFAAIVLVLAVVGGLVWMLIAPVLSPGKMLNVGGFAQIKAGMTQAELEALLGGPPGNYGRHANGTSMMTLEGFETPPDAREEIWCDDSTRFEIYFDANGRVVAWHRRAGYSQEPLPGLFDRIRDWLGF